MTFQPNPVRRPREQVESQLREAIFSGEFGSGDKLPSEMELAESFSVSRTTVRAALGSLETAGLINKVPGATGGSFVRVVDHQSLASSFRESLENTLRFGNIEFDEVIRVRRMLEIPSVELAAEHRTDEDLALIKEILDRQKGTTVEDPALSALDTSFHVAVAESAKNRVLASFVSALHRAIQPALMLEISPEVGRESVTQHLAIARAITTKDPAAARKAMDEHLEYLDRIRAARK